ncbi:MAG TPA: rhodanese-like domain-containing protein, partial [Planctomycetota bacterium]|nr:rhodanese-like domain-containing protein [Planctomycetota bacterium]
MEARTQGCPPAVAVAALLFAGFDAPVPAQDAERQMHADEASRPRVSVEDKGAHHVLRQYQLGCLSHLSYLIVSGGEAAVVDPQRDVDHYLADAKALGGKIRFVLLTHPHADFVAGHTELAQRAGAEILIAAKAGAAFPHKALRDGERVAVGTATIEAWETPGHTPNAMTFLVRVPGATADPAYALTGDTLFIGGIGRPDLLDVPPAGLAAQAWDSIHRLAALPDATRVLPAHGAGSLCGAHLSPETSSTIGAEKASNPYLSFKSRARFVADLLSHQPVAPPYFAYNVAMNLAGPPLVQRTAELPQAVEPAALQRTLGDAGFVVDLRDQRQYANGHVAGAVNVALRGRLDTWTGIVVPVDAPIVLAGSDDEVREGVFRLRRIGYDRIAGRLAGDAAAWRAGGLDVRETRLIAPKELFAAMQAGSEPLIVDVRTADEYADVRLGDVGNIPVTDSARFAAVFERNAPVVMVCNSAYRSSIAVGLAERAGFRTVSSLDGGLDAWIESGLPVTGRLARQAPPKEARAVVLPEPVDAAFVRRVLADQPQGYAVVDVRPAWQFADWHVPSSVNVAPDGVVAHLAALPADLRVVFVDRDGTLAFAVAGAVAPHVPQRALRVLIGGVQAYYGATAFGTAASPMPQERQAQPPQ